MRRFAVDTIQVALATFAMMFCIALPAHAETVERESRSSAGFASERGLDTRRDPMSLTLQQSTPRTGKPMPQGALKSSRTLAAACCAFRIYFADTELFDDFDGDGYYTYLRVIFDVDTDFLAADVYADVYVAPVGAPWELIFESEVFSIFGASPDDDYEVETEFVTGYPPGEYDVLIDIYDANSGELVVTYGPADSSALSYLPIEDISFDADAQTQVVISSGGGGSPSLMSLMVLVGLVWRRKDKELEILSRRRC